MPHRTLEETEAEVMKYIEVHMTELGGNPPSLTEIGAGVGIAPSTAQRYVRMLVKQGLLVRPKRDGLYARNINMPLAIWLPEAPRPQGMPRRNWAQVLSSLGQRLAGIIT